MNLSEKEIKNEKNYLDYTLKIIRGQISELGQQLYEKQEKIIYSLGNYESENHD